jgi:aminobenzoyl-glutamate utilization protein B
MNVPVTLISLIILAFFSPMMSVSAETDDLSEWIGNEVEASGQRSSQLALQIWNWAEVGYLEAKSSAALQQELGSAGFSVEVPVAGLPTAFVASYGKGSPVIGVLAEFDALPGMSQAAEATRHPLTENGAGHACGHHLFGAGSVAGAIAVAKRLKKTGQSGTIKVFGSPAEEGGSGKVYMVRAGLFKDVDVVLHWHPSDLNGAGNATTLANKSAKFRFHGVTAHAAAAPHRGRSALDGAESMNYMVNMLREHVTPDTRIHYVITDGGDVPNVVPSFSEVYYFVRSSDAKSVQQTWARIEKAAQGAALGTGTRVESEVIHGNYSTLPNVALSSVVHRHLKYFGGVEYSQADLQFATQIQKTFPAGSPTPGLKQAQIVYPYSAQILEIPASTDVGDVSWQVPTVGLSTATWVPGTGAHSWQAVAAGGNPIAAKGMLLAAKVLARTALDLMVSPGIIESAREEFEERRGPNFIYTPLLGDRDPPLDYRAQ